MTPNDSKNSIHRFHHRLPSTLEGINKTVAELTDFIKEIELKTNYFALIFLVREALNNAVIHGNKMSPTKQVQIDVVVEGANISITIRDEGDGFHWRKWVDRQPVNPEKTSGRGVYALQQYGYSIRYNDKGNILHLNREI
ncbi:MAG: ATP-binding protein [Proteobacteria bacterium]|nr:ATP-binding protein [Pseudomonadota bacterium]MBU1641284.1 ATP-binding protein [Pseudomonadota bacterium]